MSEPPLLDYATEEKQTPIPWWIVTCAIFVILQCALIALAGLAIARDERTPANLIGLCVFVFAIVVAWSEWTLLRDRDPDSALIVNLVCGLVTTLAAILLVRVISQMSLLPDNAALAIAAAAMIAAEIATMVAQHRFTHAAAHTSR